MIFDEVTLRKLNQLSLVAGKVRSGLIKGERRSTRRGSSVEFADYRDYVPGDDLRRLDWNVFARLERPFIKLLEEEEDLAVYILLDASRSMDWGQAEQHKFTYALRLGAALGAIALAAGDQLSLVTLRPDGAQPQVGPWRGPQHLLRLLAHLESQSPAGGTDLSRSLTLFSQQPRRPGLLFLVSDLFSASAWQPPLDRLLGAGFEAVLLHLLSPDELDPPLAGDLRLRDLETGAFQEVSIDAGMRTLYRQRLQSWQDGIQAACRQRGMRYLPVSTRTPWDALVLRDFRQAGLAK